MQGAIMAAARPKGVVRAATLGLKASLVAWWALDEASGNRADSHSGNFTLTDTNTVTSNTGVGGVGTAAEFASGNSEQLTSASGASILQAGAYSVDFWFYLTHNDSHGMGFLLTNDAGAAGNYALRYTNTEALEFDIYTSSFKSFTYALPYAGIASAWQHVTITWSGAALKVYLNAAEITMTDGGGAGTGWGTGFSIGRWYATGPYWTGRITKWGIFSVALSQANITALHNGGNGVVYAQL